MSTRFTIDLAHPGTGQRSQWDYFTGPGGPRHLLTVAVGGIALLAIIGLGGVLPQYLRYNSEIAAVAKLKREVALARDELSTLQTNLKDLGAEARRQVRWADLLPVFSQRVPETLKIDRMSLTKRAGGEAGEVGLQIEASTKTGAGKSPLEEIASFMGALAQDPVVASRFQLRTWEVKSGGAPGAGEPSLRISIGLAEKRS